jgi:DNA repair exonuclease SbcCD ATPase subunit
VPATARSGGGTPVAHLGRVFQGFTVVMLLACGADPDAPDARKELDSCAERIEELKAQRRAGELARRELERLLVRAQELAAELERTRQAMPAAPTAPSPEELRERADAARDEADRLAAAIAELDVKLGDARRLARAESDGTVARAVLGGPAASPTAERVRALAAQRAALTERRAQAETAAERYEAEARAAEVDR